jgi:hypothetical protein
MRKILEMEGDGRRSRNGVQASKKSFGAGASQLSPQPPSEPRPEPSPRVRALDGEAVDGAHPLDVEDPLSAEPMAHEILINPSAAQVTGDTGGTGDTGRQRWAWMACPRRVCETEVQMWRC